MEQGGELFMGTYQVYQGQETIGTAETETEGLYTKVSCTCRIDGSILYRLVAEHEGQKADFGILIPMGDQFGVRTKIATKKIPADAVFRIVPKNKVAGQKFIPVYPEEPFSYIEQLKHSVFLRKNGQAGILIDE